MGTIVNHEGEGGHDTHAGGEPRQCSQFDSTSGEYDSQHNAKKRKKREREKERKREREKAGITDNIVRLSVATENIEDLIEDLDNALRQIS